MILGNGGGFCSKNKNKNRKNQDFPFRNFTMWAPLNRDFFFFHRIHQKTFTARSELV